MTFGNRVARLRDEKGMSQKDLGLIVDTGKDMISRYERGLIIPSLEVAGKIARALGVPLDFLVFGVDSQVNDREFDMKLQEISGLADEDRGHIIAVIDAFITKAKLRKIID